MRIHETRDERDDRAAAVRRMMAIAEVLGAVGNASDLHDAALALEAVAARAALTDAEGRVWAA